MENRIDERRWLNNMKIVIATLKSWNVQNAKKLEKLYDGRISIEIITEREQLNVANLIKINPRYIFFPHWSWLIPKDIYNIFDCIVFHMTDLPFGRGGSPLQNIISMGLKDTKISALKVEEGIDTGPIYLKEDLSLEGTAEEILIRASEIIYNNMIMKIIDNDIIPNKQEGDIVVFKRRSESESEINNKLTLEQVYDHIRMLDGDGYPKAFIQFGSYKLRFCKANLVKNKIIANVEIMEEE